MTLERIVGQVLWCGWGEPPEEAPREYNHHARFLVEEIGVGGLALFHRNLGNPTEIAALTETIRRRSSLPPLIGIDQEGGRVSRMPLPGMVFPGNMALGLLDDPDLTQQVSRAIGVQLAAVGFNVDFAPSVDVNNNPKNPIIGVRSFGGDPKLVARHGIAAMSGFRQAGILPVIKHFPGHGDTGKDSHLELPEQPAPRERLEAVELAPFRAAIAAGAPAIMTTHILFPALDPQLPATLSRRILTGVLREELGFDGLVVTDCLEMQGIAGHWGPEEAAILALEAGADMLLVCHTQKTQARMYQALLDAVAAGRLSEARLREAAARVARARDLVASVSDAALSPEKVSADEFLRFESDLADRSLAILSPPARPFSPLSPDLPVLVTGAPGPAAALAGALTLAGFKAAVQPVNQVMNQIHTQLVWVVLPRDPFKNGVPDPKALAYLADHPNAVVVAAQEPYCLEHYPATLPRVAAWNWLPSQMGALARWLSGTRSSPLRMLNLRQ